MRVFLQLGQIPPQHTFLDLRCTRRQHFDHPEMDTSEQAIRPLDQREVMIDYPRYYHATVPIAPQGDHTTPHEAGWYALDRSESPSHVHGTDDRLNQTWNAIQQVMYWRAQARLRRLNAVSSLLPTIDLRSLLARLSAASHRVALLMHLICAFAVAAPGSPNR